MVDIENRIRQIRKKLNLSQEQAGEILGGGKRAFQKYETGLVKPAKSMENLLLLLEDDSNLLGILKCLQESERIYREA